MSSPVGGTDHGGSEASPAGGDALLARTAEATVDELLELVRTYARVDVAFVGEFSHGRRIVRFVSGEGPAATTLVDRSHALGQTYCKLVAERQIPPTVPDVREVPVLRELPITAELDIGCYVGVPIHLSDGTLYGTLCGFAHEPVDELDADLIWLLNVVAETLARRLESPADAFVDVLAVHERIEAVLADPDQLQIVHQPIRVVDSMTAVGFEALSRFPGDAPQPPDVWFADACSIGLGVELELLAVRRALATMGDLPDDAFLTVNVGGAALRDPRFADLLGAVDPQRLVVELTEGEPGHDVLSPERRRELHEAGVRLAVDDLGAGFAGLTRLVDLQPEIVKVDRFLIIGVADDPRRSALLSAAMHFCRSTGAVLVAEGVERPEDLATIVELEVPLAQGYLLGRPAPPGTSAA